ncbi:MAG: hypothetical protein ABIO02_01800 [Patescibacteria group bacterium]
MKTLLTAIIFFGIGFAACYGWLQYEHIQEQNTMLKKDVNAKLSATPAPINIKVVAPTSATPGTSQAPMQKASVEGFIGYPAEGVPPLQIYAINSTDKTKFVFIETQKNQLTFTMNSIEPGTYYFVAYAKDNNALSGGYTKAVACGLSVNCTDHALIPVTLTAGETNKEVQVKDWYAPEGSFPKKP